MQKRLRPTACPTLSLTIEYICIKTFFSNHAWVSYTGFTEAYNDATEKINSGIKHGEKSRT